MTSHVLHTGLKLRRKTGIQKKVLKTEYHIRAIKDRSQLVATP